jgi:hypothetical protein
MSYRLVQFEHDGYVWIESLDADRRKVGISQERQSIRARGEFCVFMKQIHDPAIGVCLASAEFFPFFCSGIHFENDLDADSGCAAHRIEDMSCNHTFHAVRMLQSSLWKGSLQGPHCHCRGTVRSRTSGQSRYRVHGYRMRATRRMSNTC